MSDRDYGYCYGRVPAAQAAIDQWWPAGVSERNKHFMARMRQLQVVLIELHRPRIEAEDAAQAKQTLAWLRAEQAALGDAAALGEAR